MATKRDVIFNTTDNTPSSTVDTVKSAFYAWLSREQGKHYSVDTIIASLDIASEQLLKRKIAVVPIWELTKSSIFAAVYNNARDHKFFRIMDKKIYSTFMRDGQLYLKFLKSKPLLQSTSYVSENQPTVGRKVAEKLTIKEAVSRILSESQQAMTTDEIYLEIIARKLYTFGAQNPKNVVRNIIESACDNSPYSKKYRSAVSCFHFEQNDDGKRVYSLLREEKSKKAEVEPTTTEESPAPLTRNITIWDAKVEHTFQEWLEREKYAQRTVDNYRRAVAQIFRSFSSLATQAVCQSKSEREAVRNYIVLLNENADFVKVNATRHNQFTAAMAALERFYSLCREIAEHKESEQAVKSPEMVSTLTSSFGNIVDLEEGKEGLREILEAHFQTLYDYTNISIVWKAAQDNLSLFLNDNAINTADELWHFMYRAFLGEYIMSNPHIWRVQPNYPQSYIGIVINLARQYGGTVTRTQIDEYFSRIKQSSPINANVIRGGHLVFYASKHFILTEAVNLSSERVAAISKALDRLVEQEQVSYIVLRDISNDWFKSLPALKGNLDWTALLLQEVLRQCSNVGYRTIFSGLDGQSLDTLGAAIVTSKSEISSFADIVHRYCYENKLLGNRMLTEDLRALLRDAGMIEGNELIYNLHKALNDYRFAFTDENRMVKILER